MCNNEKTWSSYIDFIHVLSGPKLGKIKIKIFFNLFLISLLPFYQKVFLFIFDFYQKFLFILTYTFGHFPVVQKFLFIMTFDFGLFPSAHVVITCGPFWFQKYIIINQEGY